MKQVDEIQASIEWNGYNYVIEKYRKYKAKIVLIALGIVMLILLLACFGCANQNDATWTPYWTDGWPATDWRQAQ